MRFPVFIIASVFLLFLSGVRHPLLVARTVIRKAAGIPAALKALFRSEAWGRFRSFWRSVDRIEPLEKSRRSGFMRAPYAHSITRDRYTGLRKTMKLRLDALVRAGLSARDRLFLEGVISERLRNMVYGPASMFTRMMPTPNLMEKEKSLQRLEAQIDRLIRLRKTGQIGGREFSRVLDSVKEEILAISVFGLVARSYGGYYPSGGVWSGTVRKKEPVERQLFLIRLHYKNFLDRVHRNPRLFSASARKNFRKKYLQVIRDLEEFRRDIPRMLSLIDRLER